jgi:hypothetical protein
MWEPQCLATLWAFKWPVTEIALLYYISLLAASAGFLLGLLFSSDNGGDTFLQNIGLPANYMVLQAKDHTLIITASAFQNAKDQDIKDIILVPPQSLI